MREKQEVLEKFREMRALKLKERKEEFLCRHSRNCFFNVRQRVKENSMVGFCQNPEVVKTVGTKVFVCNDVETAHRCGCFKCKNTEESVKNDFEETLKSPARCGQDYPKLAILIWFLQDYGSQDRWGRLVKIVISVGKGIYRIFSFKWW